MRIGLDCDGVLYDFVGEIQKYAEKRLRVTGLSPFVHWNTHQKHWGLSHDMLKELMKDALLAGELWSSGRATDGAKETTWALRDLGHTIVIATDRHLPGAEKQAEKATRGWLRANNIWHDELIFTADKRDANCDIFLDDRPQAIPLLRLHGVEALYYTRPWNAWFAGYPRVNDFAEFYDFVRKYEYDHRSKTDVSAETNDGTTANGAAWYRP